MTRQAFRRILLTVAVFLLVLAQGTGLAGRADASGNKHFLWKVTSRTNSVYLIGSIHFLKPGDYPLDPAYEKAYSASKRVQFEIDLNSVDERKIRQLTLDKGTYSGGQSLSRALSKQAYDQVKQKISKLGLGMEQVENLKPWFLGITIAVGELQRLGYDPNQGVDRYFAGKAARDGKETGGLETAEYQLNLFANMPDNVQEQLLLQTLGDLQETEAHFNEIREAWKKGDAKALEAYLLKSFTEYPAVQQSLIVERNRNWVPRIERLIGQKENVMVVVGAAHLVGRDGIIAVLKQKGYQVEQE